MKYLIVIPDGAADAAQQSLGGKTPLQAARTPAMDALASRGRTGLTNHVPQGLPPGSEVACMSLMGYDPLQYFTGRAPLEAAAQGIVLGEHDWAVRCNLVTIADHNGSKKIAGAVEAGEVMKDFTAGHISTAEASSLLAAAGQGLEADFPQLSGWQFVPGVSYRNLLLYRGHPGVSPLANNLRTTPPHDLMDRSVTDDFPRGTGSRLLTEIMSHSALWLKDHPVNKARLAAGKLPATHVWLWGAGRAPRIEPFFEKYRINGTMITAVDLLRGLASLAGWERIDVPGATGYLDTDYAAKGRAAIAALSTSDLVCVHVEAPDEASHEGNADAKVRAIEQIDALIVKPLMDHLAGVAGHRILVCPDHLTLLSTKTHSRGSVPFVMAGDGVMASGQRTYDEAAAAKGGDTIQPGWKLMEAFLHSSHSGDGGHGGHGGHRNH